MKYTDENEREFLFSYDKNVSHLIDSETRLIAQQKGWEIEENEFGNVKVTGKRVESKVEEKASSLFTNTNYSENEVDSILNSALMEPLNIRIKKLIKNNLQNIYDFLLRILGLNYIICDMNVSFYKECYIPEVALIQMSNSLIIPKYGDLFKIKAKHVDFIVTVHSYAKDKEGKRWIQCTLFGKHSGISIENNVWIKKVKFYKVNIAPKNVKFHI